MKTWFGYTWVGWSNIIVLQWLFIRLSYAENSDGSIENWSVMFPIVPLTGWWGSYFPSKYWDVKL